MRVWEGLRKFSKYLLCFYIILKIKNTEMINIILAFYTKSFFQEMSNISL